MPWYVVYRHGWDEANQSPERGQPQKMAVTRVEADTPEEACRRAQPALTLAPGQYLSAELAQRVDAKESTLNLTARTQHSPPGGEEDVRP
jgi:hypothetical protein